MTRPVEQVSAPSARRTRVAALVIVASCVLFAMAIDPALSGPDQRATLSGVALVLSGVAVAVSASLRSRVRDRHRRSWQLLAAGAVVAVAGNVWFAVVGADPVTAPSDLTDATIVVALLLCIAAVVLFPGVRRRGVERWVLVLDGLVISGAVVIIATTLVYDSLARQRGEGPVSVATLLIPVLDVVLIVAALLLLLRTRGADRGALILLALGFLSYGVSDLTFAVEVSRDTFAFGSYVDLGWVVGYALIALAAWFPAGSSSLPAGTTAQAQSEGGGASGVRDTLLVYGGLLLALLVQLTVGPRGGSVVVDLLWFVVVAAAVGRQVAVTQDNATLRRRLEQRVREQTSDLARMARTNETLLSSVADGIYGVDAEGVTTFVNPSGASALRYAPEQLLGRAAHEMFHAPDPGGAPHPYADCYVAEAIRSGVVTNAEEDVYVRSDGSQFAVEITASPLQDGDTVLGAVVAFRDVTQRREVDRMKDEFISVVSHELRTPLTSIRGSLGLLTSGKLGELAPRAQSMAALALESSERLTRLINDILDLERIESGARPMEVQATDAAELLTRAIAEMGGMARAHDVGLELTEGAGRVLADPDQVLQTLTNLVNNAVKFSAAGTVVELGSRVQGAEVVLQVRDRGRGIPADRLESIFERFEQVDSSDARALGGTGLGLAISRSIVERHGGRIWATSVVGQGTTVSFTLPGAERPAPGAQAPPAPAPTGPAVVRRGAAVPQVLVVEDDDDLAAVLTTLLAGHAIAVTRVAGVRAAVAATAATDVDLVVLDVVLEDGEAYELVDALRADERTAGLDVVVYSADDVHPRDQDRLRLGRTVFVTKGRLDPSGVEEHVLSLLQSRADGAAERP